MTIIIKQGHLSLLLKRCLVAESQTMYNLHNRKELVLSFGEIPYKWIAVIPKTTKILNTMWREAVKLGAN